MGKNYEIKIVRFVFVKSIKKHSMDSMHSIKLIVLHLRTVIK